MVNPLARVSEDDKKILKLTRKLQLDHDSLKLLIYHGLTNRTNCIEKHMEGIKDEFIREMMQRDLDKYTKLLEALEKGE